MLNIKPVSHDKQKSSARSEFPVFPLAHILVGNSTANTLVGDSTAHTLVENSKAHTLVGNFDVFSTLLELVTLCCLNMEFLNKSVEKGNPFTQELSFSGWYCLKVPPSRDSLLTYDSFRKMWHLMWEQNTRAEIHSCIVSTP